MTLVPHMLESQSKALKTRIKV